jgi:hypothetical protein
MIIFRTLILILALFTVPFICFADQSEKAIKRVVKQVEEKFPFVEGVVIAVKDGEIVLNLKEGHPIKVGDRLRLFRYGDEMVHPTTGKKLGRMETRIGEVELVAIGSNFSRALPADPLIKAQKGDGVRARFKQINILIATQGKAQPGNELDALNVRLEEAFKSNPRFKVPSFDLDLWLLENEISRKSLTEADTLSRLSKIAKVDFVLFSRVHKIKKRSALEYRLVSVDSGIEIKQAKVLLGRLSKVEQAKRKRNREQKNQFGFESESNVKFLRKQTFPFEIVDFDIGDINGDGKKEIIVVDSHRVMIYKVAGEQLSRIASIGFKKNVNQFLAVDVGDINENGKDEIFVTNKYLEGLSSFVLELDGRKLKKKWENVDYYFRIIRPFGAAAELLVQSTGYREPFEGGIKVIKYRQGQYVPVKTLATDFGRHVKVILYGLTRSDINLDGKIETLMLDNGYHLRVYSATGSLIIQSDEYYGHDPRLIDIGVVRQVSGLEVQGKPERYRGRLLLEKFGNKRFILIPKNHTFGGGLLSSLVLVNNSNLVIMSAQEEGFKKVAETKKQKGYLAAFQVASFPGENKKKKIYVATVEKGGIASETESSIFIYDWKF